MIPHLVNFAERFRHRGSSGSADPPAGKPLARREASAVAPAFANRPKHDDVVSRSGPPAFPIHGQGAQHAGRKPRSRNLAASAGAWSARHRRKAIFAWLVFVVAAYVVGGLVGQRNLTDAQMGNGQSATALSVFENAFPYHNGEEVLVQARAGSPSDQTAVPAAVADLVTRLRRLPTVADIESPFPVPGAVTSPALRSADGRSVLVTFELAGNSNQAENYVERSSGRHGRDRCRPPAALGRRSAARPARPRRWARPSARTSPRPSTPRYRSPS